MQYFTQIFFEEIEFGSEEDKRLNRLWEDAHEKYQQQLRKLQHRVSKRLYKVIEKNELHDTTFRKIEMEYTKRGKFPLDINLYLDSKRIKYKGVRNLITDIYKEQEFSYKGIGDCIITELLEIDDSYLSHELLFSTGAKIYIESKKVMI